MKFTKAKFTTARRMGYGRDKKPSRVEVDGYRFAYALDDGREVDMYTYKDETGNWYVIDPGTGSSLGWAQTTRGKAVDQSMRFCDKFTKLYGTESYRKMAERFAGMPEWRG